MTFCLIVMSILTDKIDEMLTLTECGAFFGGVINIVAVIKLVIWQVYQYIVTLVSVVG